ncbi:MAG TPA: hypothetical protein VMP11_12195 [Verrucomicrobiae bacterium]|nr:hypothetical protein [Verrucomicrobiae bacterium]
MKHGVAELDVLAPARKLRGGLFWAGVASIIVTLPLTAFAGSGAKLSVQPVTHGVVVSQTAEVNVVLEDAENKPVPASKDLTVEVETKSASGQTNTLEVTIGKGKESGMIAIPTAEAGLLHIRAKQRELLDGSAIMHVRPATFEQPRADLTAPALESSTASVAKSESTALAQLNDRLDGDVGSAMNKTLPEPVAEAATAESRPALYLWYSPERGLLADGTDEATIQASLLQAAPWDVLVTLRDSTGNMHPSPPLKIPQGQTSVTSTLTWNHTGNVTVEYLGAQPSVDYQGNPKIEMTFVPPITKLDASASPHTITLADQSELVARLVDKQGQAYCPDEPRNVSFVIKEGRGTIKYTELIIPTSNSEARTLLYPTWPGHLVITARADQLADEDVAIDVNWPVGLFAATVVGGLVGACVASYKKKKAWPLRLASGLAAAFVLYWGVVFAVPTYSGLFKYLDRGWITNPVMAGLVAVFGGWIGPKRAFKALLPD